MVLENRLQTQPQRVMVEIYRLGERVTSTGQRGQMISALGTSEIATTDGFQMDVKPIYMLVISGAKRKEQFGMVRYDLQIFHCQGLY